jgi:homoaconitase/3-isopropylmalate dehydratase large subunit
MGMTMVEKVLAGTSGRDSVQVGDILECTVDQIVQVDLSFTLMDKIPTRVKAPEKVSVVFDHAVPALGTPWGFWEGGSGVSAQARETSREEWAVQNQRSFSPHLPVLPLPP